MLFVPRSKIMNHKIIIFERGGYKLQDLLMNFDPFPFQQCGRKYCLPYNSNIEKPLIKLCWRLNFLILIRMHKVQKK